MQKQMMEIVILPSGEVKVQVKCVSGPSCAEVSAGLEKALGAVVDRQHTGEYYEDGGDGGDSGS